MRRGGPFVVSLRLSPLESIAKLAAVGNYGSLELAGLEVCVETN